jgi:hypothetical protein
MVDAFARYVKLLVLTGSSLKPRGDLPSQMLQFLHRVDRSNEFKHTIGFVWE